MSRSPYRRPMRLAASKRPRGAALIMCLFMIFMVSSLALNIVQTETLQLAGTRNAIAYEQSLYLANAGVHHVCALIAANNTWRGTITDGVLPPSAPVSGYSATAVDDALGNVVITATGYSGQGKRTVLATVEL